MILKALSLRLMTGAGIFTRDAMTAEIRRRLDAHDAWDGLHQFAILRWKGGQEFACSTLAVIDPRMHARDYPDAMQQIASEHMRRFPAERPDAFLLEFEGWGVIAPAEDASDEEKTQFDRDRLNRTFHQRPDAMEGLTVACADIYGRLWVGHKLRKPPAGLAVTDVLFYRPGNYRLRGRIPEALLAVAASARQLTSAAN